MNRLYITVIVREPFNKNKYNARCCISIHSLSADTEVQVSIMKGKNKTVSLVDPTFSILVGVLEGLDQTQSLVHQATHGQVVNGDLPQYTLIVDHKQTPVRGTR